MNKELILWPTISRPEVGKYLEGNTDRVLLVASSFAAYDVRKYGKVRNKIPVPLLPESILYKGADCGGFVATFKWNGEYKYTPEQYVEWLDGWKPDWAATMDYCCEQEIASNGGIVKKRQDMTTENAKMFFKRWKDKPYMWVPTLQGWTLEDYLYHAYEMKSLILEMKEYYGDKFMIGIGTLCHRAKINFIRLVVQEICKIFPDINIHLWGVKKSIFSSYIGLPYNVVSCDTAAFNGMWGKGREKYHNSGKKQVQYSLEDALPEYRESFYKLANREKQFNSLWEIDQENT